MPKFTSRQRHIQLGILSQVLSCDSLVQLRTLHTTQQTPVTHPRPISSHSPTFLRMLICSRVRMRPGYAARTKSEIAEMMPCARMICRSCSFEKHFAVFRSSSSHTADTGRHCRIHSNVRMRFETKRSTTIICNGRFKALVTGMRYRKREMETLVHMSVAKV